MMNRIVYICDGKACDHKEFSSCKGDYPGVDVCHHTTDPKHAKYGICEDPVNHPERFELLEDGDFWEI
jgi:hypothetical protein